MEPVYHHPPATPALPEGCLPHVGVDRGCATVEIISPGRFAATIAIFVRSTAL
jgi:hypothetical protein